MSNPVGFWIRFLAMILDGILIFIVFGFVNLLLYNSFIVETFTFTDILQLFYYHSCSLVWLYRWKKGDRYTDRSDEW